MSKDDCAREFQPPARPEKGSGRVQVFLAGSIEMGKATEWQRRAVKEFAGLPVDVLNPRRKDWDPSWEQRASNPRFREQVEWELDFLERADLVALYFEPGTDSMITLAEHGILCGIRPEKVVVCCPVGYKRLGNVEIMNSRYGVTHVFSFDEWLQVVKERLAKLVEERRREAVECASCSTAASV